MLSVSPDSPKNHQTEARRFETGGAKPQQRLLPDKPASRVEPDIALPGAGLGLEEKGMGPGAGGEGNGRDGRGAPVTLAAKRPSGSRLEAAAVVAARGRVLLEAVAAVHRASLRGLEGDLGLLAAVAADG